MAKRKHLKPQIVALCILLALCLVAGSVLAYMFLKTSQLDNQFDPATVTCQVNVNNDNTFDVTNTGDVNAYIRASIVVNWMDEDGNVRGIAPTESEYTLSVNTTDWQQDSETGYYYYKVPVSPNNVTNDLVTAYGLAESVTAPNGYELCVEVVAEAIQADGTTDTGDIPAYQDAWGISKIY